MTSGTTMTDTPDPVFEHAVTLDQWTVQCGDDRVVVRVLIHEAPDGKQRFEVRLSFNGSRFYSRVHPAAREAMREAGEMLEDRTQRGWVVVTDEAKTTH